MSTSSSIPTTEELQLLHRNVCYALSDPTRLQILYVLQQKPQHVNGLVDALQIPQPTVSRHLNILRQRQLVRGTRNGNMIVYELTDDRLITILDAMRELMAELLHNQTQSLS